MSERKYLPSKETALALLKEFAKASSLVAPYELRAMTRPAGGYDFPVFECRSGMERNAVRH